MKMLIPHSYVFFFFFFLIVKTGCNGEMSSFCQGRSFTCVTLPCGASLEIKCSFVHCRVMVQHKEISIHFLIASSVVRGNSVSLGEPEEQGIQFSDCIMDA